MKGSKNGAMDFGPSIVLGVVLLLAWEGIVRLFHVPNFVIPAPSEIAVSLYRNAGPLGVATVATAKEVLVGFVLATLVGVALALLIVRFRLLGRALYPIIVLFQTVPKVALAPIFILWFGYDLAPKVLLIVVIAFFPVTLDMLSGLQSVDPGLVSLMRSVGAKETDIMLRVRIPNSLPHLMSGMKIAITFSVIGAIVGEFAGASAGLGYMIQFASTQLDTPLIFAALIVVSVVGVVFYYLIELLERVATPWSPKFDFTQQA
jgi:NitT/TauT family transport system permease protein